MVIPDDYMSIPYSISCTVAQFPDCIPLFPLYYLWDFEKGAWVLIEEKDKPIKGDAPRQKHIKTGLKRLNAKEITHCFGLKSDKKVVNVYIRLWKNLSKTPNVCPLERPMGRRGSGENYLPAFEK